MKRLLFPALVLCALLLTCACAYNSERYFELGTTEYDKGNYAEAELAYRKALQKNPRNGDAYYRLGLSQLKLNKIAKAVTSLQRACRLMPDHIEARVALADILLSAYFGDASRPQYLLDELLALRKQLQAKQPNSFDSLRVSGYVALAQGNRTELLSFLRKANSVKPMQPAVVFALCQNLILENQGPEAEKLALEFLAKEKTHGQVYDLLYLYYRSTQRDLDAQAILENKVSNNPAVSSYRVQLATHYASIGRREQSDAALRYLLENAKTFPGAYLDVGDYHLRNQELDAAIKQYDQGIRANPEQQLLYRKRIIDALLFQQKFDEARRVIDEILKDFPKDIEIRIVKSSLRLGTGQPGEISTAIREFQQLVDESPDDPILRFHLGRARMAQLNYRPALREFEEAVKRRRDLLPARMALAELNLYLRQYKEGLQQTQEILTQSEGNIRGRLLRSAALAGLENFIVARTELQKLIQEHPDFIEAHLQLALLDVAEGRYVEAERVFRKFYRPGQADPRVLRGLVELYAVQRRFDTAIQLLQEEVVKAPSAPLAARSMLAETAARAGRVDVAIPAYLDLLGVHPKPDDIHHQLSGLYYAKGDARKAIEHLEQARHIAPENTTVLLNLGSMLERDNRVREAQDLYRKALAIDPDNPVALNNLAFSFVESGGDLDEALSLAQRAVRKMPSEPHFSDTMAWIYLKKNMTNAALQVFENLVRKHPDTPTFRYHLGAALYQKGEKARAKAELEAALSRRPSKQQEIAIRELITRIG
jgi:tetratricopeptide (TPR) repeat protein